MAVKWNKIYRGGVQRTTPETREANLEGFAGTLRAGVALSLAQDAEGMSVVSGVAPNGFFYIVGEPLFGDVDDNLFAPEGQESSIRMYTPRSGDLYAVRAVAGIEMYDDMPLTIDENGRFAPATPGDETTPASPVHAYVDNPASAHPRTAAPTVLDQLIPIKIK